MQQIISDDAVNGCLFLLPGLTVAKAGIEGLPTRRYDSLSFDLTDVS